MTIETTSTHPWLIGLILANGDYKLVAEIMHVDEQEVGRYKVMHAREIAEGLYANLTAKVMGELIDRVDQLHDSSLLKLFEVIKGNVVINQQNVQNNDYGSSDALMRLAERMGITTYEGRE